MTTGQQSMSTGKRRSTHVSGNFDFPSIPTSSRPGSSSPNRDLFQSRAPTRLPPPLSLPSHALPQQTMFTYRYPHPLPSPSSTYRHHRSLTFRDMVIIAEGTTDLNVLISVAHAASSRAHSVLRRILERAGIPIPSSDTFKTSHTVRVELATKFARVAWSRRRTPLAEAWFDADADDRSHSLSLLSFPPWVLSRFHSYIDPPSPFSLALCFVGVHCDGSHPLPLLLVSSEKKNME